MNIYHGYWENSGINGPYADFKIDMSKLEDVTIHYAGYFSEEYDGYAFVLFSKNGKLYEVNGSHCSCNGLEGQWEPEETTVAAIRHRLDNGKILSKEEHENIRAALVHAERSIDSKRIEKELDVWEKKQAERIVPLSSILPPSGMAKDIKEKKDSESNEKLIHAYDMKRIELTEALFGSAAFLDRLGTSKDVLVLASELMAIARSLEGK